MSIPPPHIFGFPATSSTSADSEATGLAIISHLRAIRRFTGLRHPGSHGRGVPRHLHPLRRSDGCCGPHKFPQHNHCALSSCLPILSRRAGRCSIIRLDYHTHPASVLRKGTPPLIPKILNAQFSADTESLPPAGVEPALLVSSHLSYGGIFIIPHRHTVLSSNQAYDSDHLFPPSLRQYSA